jgi:tetratricopeptide (TPR) repeat protein
MFQAASELLRDRSPLVVGYSGEVDDVFLQAMKNRPMPVARSHGYWFCYNPVDVPRIQDLLSFDRSVRIVIADSGVLSAETTMAALADRLQPGLTTHATPWKLPEFHVEIGESQSQTFVRAAENLRFQELESTELVELTEHLMKCFDKLSDGDATKARATEFAVRVAEILLSRDGSKLEYRLLHAKTLLSRGYFSVVCERYAESLPHLEQIKQDYQRESDPSFVESVAGARFYLAIALKNLGRVRDSIGEARGCLLAYSSFAQPRILSYTMMTASNLTLELTRKASKKRLAEAWRWLVWIQAVYPGSNNGNCVEAYYKSAFIQSELFENQGRFGAALAALERIVKGRKELATLGQETARYAIEERSRILVTMKQYARANVELGRLGRYFGSDREIQLRERLGRNAIRKEIMLKDLGVLGGPESEKRLKEIQRLCGLAVSTELLSLIAHCFVMLIEQYSNEHLFDEALSAAQDLFDSFGTKPAEASLRQPVATGLSLRCKTMVAKINKLLVDKNELPTGLPSDLIRAAEPLKTIGEPVGSFFSAYGYFLLGNLHDASSEAVAGARLASADVRTRFLEYDFTVKDDWMNEENEVEPLAVVAFRKWFKEVIVDVPVSPNQKQKAKLPPRRFTARWAFSNDPN